MHTHSHSRARTRAHIHRSPETRLETSAGAGPHRPCTCTTDPCQCNVAPPRPGRTRPLAPNTPHALTPRRGGRQDSANSKEGAAARRAPSLQPFQRQLLDGDGDLRVADGDLQPGPPPHARVPAPSPVDSFWTWGVEPQPLEPLRHLGQRLVHKRPLGSAQRRGDGHHRKSERNTRHRHARRVTRTSTQMRTLRAWKTCRT